MAENILPGKDDADRTKKIVNALHALNGELDTLRRNKDQLSDFSKRLYEASSIADSYSNAQSSLKKSVRETSKDIEKQKKKVERLEKAYASGAKKKKEYNKESKELAKEIEHLESVHKTFADSVVAGTKVTKERVKNEKILKGVIAETSKTADRAAALKKDFYSSDSKKQAAAIKELTALRINDIRVQLKSRKIEEKTAKEQIKNVSRYINDLMDPDKSIKKYEKMFAGIRGKTAEGGDLSKEGQRKSKKEFTEGVLSGAGGLKSDLKGIFSLKGDHGAGLKGLQEKKNQVGSAFIAERKMLKEAGKTGAGLSKVAVGFSLLTKALSGLSKLNIFMMLISIGKGMIDLVNQMNKLMTTANTAHFALNGPITSLADLEKNALRFTDTLYNAEIKMKYGLNAKDVEEVYKGYSSSGMSSQGISQFIGSHEKAIETAIVQSKSFGVGMSDMGGMIADQMLNLRSSLDDVSDGFRKMSFDAAMAGVNSQKFYQGLLNATTGLSFYGNYLKETSGILSNFIAQGTLGFKDATAHAQGLMQTVGNMDYKQLLKISGVVGFDVVENIAKRHHKEAKEELEAVNKEIIDATEKRNNLEVGSKAREKADEELETLKKEQLLAQGKEYTARGWMNGDISAQGQAMKAEYLENPQKLIYDLADAMRTSVTGNDQNKQLELRAKMMSFGFTEKDFEMMMTRVYATKGTLEDVGMEKLKNANLALNSEGDKKVLKDLSTLFKSGKSNEEIAKLVDTRLKELKEPGEIQTAATLVDLQKKGLNYLKAFVEVSNKGTFKEDADMVEAVHRAYTLLPGEAGSVDASKEKALAMKVAEMTTPLTKFLDISKENLMYAAASSDPMRDMLSAMTSNVQNTGGIFNILTGWWRGKNKGKEDAWNSTKGSGGKYKSSDKDLYTNLVARGYKTEEELKKKQVALQKGDLKEEEKALLKKQIEELEAKNDKITADKKFYETKYPTLVREAQQEGYRRRNTGMASVDLSTISKTESLRSENDITRSSQFLMPNSEKEYHLRSLMDDKLLPGYKKTSLDQMFKGLTNDQKEYLVENKEAMQALIGHFYKGTGGKSWQEALDSKEVKLDINLNGDNFLDLIDVTATAKANEAVQRGRTTSEGKK